MAAPSSVSRISSPSSCRAPASRWTSSVERGGAATLLRVTPARVKRIDRFGNVIEHGRLGVAAQRSGRGTGRGGGGDRRWYQRHRRDHRQHRHTLRQVVMGAAQPGRPGRADQDRPGDRAAGVAGRCCRSSPSWRSFRSTSALSICCPSRCWTAAIFCFTRSKPCRRRPMGAKTQEWAFMSGFAALMTLHGRADLE